MEKSLNQIEMIDMSSLPSTIENKNDIVEDIEDVEKTTDEAAEEIIEELIEELPEQNIEEIIEELIEENPGNDPEKSELKLNSKLQSELESQSEPESTYEKINNAIKEWFIWMMCRLRDPIILILIIFISLVCSFLAGKIYNYSYSDIYQINVYVAGLLYFSFIISSATTIIPSNKKH